MQYISKAGETLYDIADRFGITFLSLKKSNPEIKYHMRPLYGETLNVPIPISNIISYTRPYSYQIFSKDLKILKGNYPFLNIESIGKSVLGKDIYVISIGQGKKHVLYNGAHHANEWITTPILMKFVEDFSRQFVDGTPIYGYDPESIFNKVTIKIAPMVNPDGVDLHINGLIEENIEFHEELIKWNNNSTDFTKWTSNIRGVDINHNYDACWEMYKKNEQSYGITGPGPRRFSGYEKVSEPETKALVNFTKSYDFRLVLAYHTQGEVIYWDYMGKSPKESFSIAQKFKMVSGYEPEEIVEGPSSTGGFKDWFIEYFRRPGFTIEAGLGENPLPISSFEEIYAKNLGILIMATMV